MQNNAGAQSRGNGLRQSNLVAEGMPSNQDTFYESQIGWHLARCLLRDCSIFIGTVEEIIEPKAQPGEVGAKNSSYVEVGVRVDQWLYGKPVDWKPQLRLEHVPAALSRANGKVLRGEVWKDVRLQVGGRILIAFDPPKGEKPGPLERVSRYGLVISNPTIFPAVESTVAAHIRFVNSPEDMTNAPSLLNTHRDKVFSSYLVSYFRSKGGHEYADTNALVISQLIGSTHILDEHRRLLEGPLIRAMTNDDYPVSEEARKQVLENLVSAGTSNNENLARPSLRVLIQLSEQEDFKPYLTDQRRQKLIQNYKALIEPGTVEKGQSSFEIQIGLKSP